MSAAASLSGPTPDEVTLGDDVAFAAAHVGWLRRDGTPSQGVGGFGFFRVGEEEHGPACQSSPHDVPRHRAGRVAADGRRHAGSVRKAG